MIYMLQVHEYMKSCSLFIKAIPHLLPSDDVVKSLQAWLAVMVPAFESIWYQIRFWGREM